MKMIPFVVFAVACFASPNMAIDCSYNRCSQNGRTHTLCSFRNPFPTRRCGRVFAVGLSKAEKNEIVNKHNELRQYVAFGRETRGNPGPQPAARNMQIMSWDNQLEEVAQRWANQCNFGHDKCRDVERFGVGQNVAITYNTGPQTSTLSSMIMMWYNEVKDFGRNRVNRFTLRNGPVVGHYTQMVWAKTNRIGCGKIVYKVNEWNTFYLVCNYGPQGNIIGEPLYEPV